MSYSLRERIFDSFAVLSFAIFIFTPIVSVVIYDYQKSDYMTKKMEIESKISENNTKLNLTHFFNREGYSDPDAAYLFNRVDSEADDLDSYLAQVKKEYEIHRYCEGPKANKGTCANFKEGVYKTNILGHALWAVLYGNLDRNISKKAQQELAKRFMTEVEIPLGIQAALANKLDFEGSPAALNFFVENQKKTSELQNELSSINLKIEKLEKNAAFYIRHH